MFKKLTESDDTVIVDTTSRSTWKELSPFFLGPVKSPNGQISKNFENLWQYSKVYKEHTDENNQPIQDYWDWAKQGWNNQKAVRYPMGKGAKPLYSLWYDGKQNLNLNYIDARKYIYAPYYADLVKNTKAFETLVELYKTKNLILRDYDGYDHDALGLTLTDVLNNPNKKMGHAFVIKMMLTNDIALKEFKYGY